MAEECERMVFIRYQHVERIDADETEGLLNGTCHVFPKMDGSNMCAYSEDGEIRTMSRNRVIEPPEPFAVFVSEHGDIARFLRNFPGLRLYGEWMVPHTVRSYVPDVWNRWFVFDVIAEDPEAVYEYDGGTLDCAGRRYLPYDVYAPLLEGYGIECIPPLAVIDHPDLNELERIADNDNTWMVAESAGCGEGVVVKRYDFTNRFGHIVWAKVLNRSFCVFKISSHGSRHEERREGTTVEHEIAVRYITQELVDKEYSRIVAEDGNPRKSVPGMLLGTVWHCLVTECMWDAVKRYRNPVVDFSLLRKECETEVKMHRPEVFGLRAMEVQTE